MLGRLASQRVLEIRQAFRGFTQVRSQFLLYFSLLIVLYPFPIDRFGLISD